MKLKSRRFGFIGLGVVLALAVVSVLVMQQRSAATADALAADSTGADSTATADGEEKETRIPVEMAEATPRDLPSYFNATGSLEARRQVDLISKAQGQVIRLAVEEGQMVGRGELLMEIEHREEQLLLDQAKVRAEMAGRELDRIEGLMEKGLGSERDHENAREAAEVAVIERDLAQVRLDNKVLRAPFAGQITIRHIELGQTVGLGQSLLSIADISPLEVKLHLPERIVKELKVGQLVEVRPDIAPDRPVRGTVERIAPAVDPATSTVKVTLRVEDPGPLARVGSFIRARVTTDVHASAISVPKRALVPEAGATFLFVAEEDTVRKVAVTTGYADDEFIEILDGVETGERVVTVGQGGLRNGSKIRDLAAEKDLEDQELASADSLDDAGSTDDKDE